MARALELAARGFYSTRPNPRVGCVIVKNGTIVGEGFHYRAGEAHAEVLALQAAEAAAVGATAYVTLEPCCHYGRTPPCVQALIGARLARVVYAVEDPNPRVAGGGARVLTQAGIAVAGGLLAVPARELNRGFFLRHTRGRPFVTAKVGMSLDGKVALANGVSQWITGAAARADVQRLRAGVDAILTGIGTVLADDPQLNVRDAKFDLAGRAPLRLVLDSGLRTPPGARIFGNLGEVWIFADENFAGRGVPPGAARVEFLARTAQGLDLAALFRRLGELELNEILVEAGPTLVGSLLAARLIDELVLYIAPVILGHTARSAFPLPELTSLSDAYRWQVIERVQVGGDERLRLAPSAALTQP